MVHSLWYHLGGVGRDLFNIIILELVFNIFARTLSSFSN